MRKWLWIAPVLLVVGCSKNQSASPQQSLASRAQGAAVTSAGDLAPAPAPAVAALTGAEIPSGTPLRVRMDEAISTSRNMAGDKFTATLADAVMVDGRSVLPAGTRMQGHVLLCAASGRFKGRARIVLSLDSFERGGRQYEIDTTAASRVTTSHKKRNIIAIGGGTGIGAAIGAIAGGGKGALIGAGAGAAAGTVGAAVTGKKQVTIPAETVLRFTLSAPVRV